MSRMISLFLLFFFSVQLSYSQDILVIDDRAGILDEQVETILAEKLTVEGISYTSTVDFKKPCMYYYGNLEQSGGDLSLRIADCDHKLLGEKNLGSSILSAPAEEKGILISYALLDIIAEPGKYFQDGPAVPVAEVPAEAAPATGPPPDSLLKNEHDSRYFFAPSARNLKKGELYYNTVYFLLHDIQYGINDYFSMGFGTSLIGMPVYLTPKLSIPLGEKSTAAIGDLFMAGTYGTDAIGNLAYGVYTYGGSDGNISLGAGYLWINENEFTSQTSSLVTNLSAMARMSPYIFFLTENYVMSANFIHEAWYETTDDQGYYEQVSEDFVQRNTFWYGMMGIRIVSKKRNFMAWQVGMTYVLNVPGEIPEKYLSWDNDAREEVQFFAFPTVTFTVKFGKKF